MGKKKPAPAPVPVAPAAPVAHAAPATYTAYFVTAEGERTDRARAACRRFDCACGGHRCDVALVDLTPTTDAEIVAYFARVHGGVT